MKQFNQLNSINVILALSNLLDYIVEELINCCSFVNTVLSGAR